MQCTKLNTYMETGRVVFLPAKSIQPNPEQPRRVFDPAALEELAQSIRRHGILQPLSVRRIGVRYELIAGERRLRAAQLAGLTEIPCIVMNMDDTESGAVALVENLQRQDLDFLEEALGLSRLIQIRNLSQEQAAKLVGKSQSAVANKLRLLRHSPPVLKAIREGGLSERHARALLKLPTEEQKLEVIALIRRLSLSVQRTEEHIDALLAPAAPPSPGKGKNMDRFLTGLNRTLARFQAEGVGVVSERTETDQEIRLTITIPKNGRGTP